MEIIQLSIDDVKKFNGDIISMLKQSFEKSFPDKRFNNNSFNTRIDALKNYIKDDNATVYGSVMEEKLIGFIWFFKKDIRTIHVNHFVVDEKSRGLGIGKLLWNKVESYAKENNIEDIELFVTKENEDAVSFYTNRDFIIDRFVMKKRVYQ